MVGGLFLLHPGQVGRSQGLAPGGVAHQRYQGAVGVAYLRGGDPVLLVGGIHRIGEEAVLGELDAVIAIRSGAVDAHGGADGAARHLQCAHQHRQHGAGPAAVEAAPAVVDGLAQGDRHRAQRHGAAVHLDGLADAGVIQVLQGNAADDLVIHVADPSGPQRGKRLHVFDQLFEGGGDLDLLVLPAILVGAQFDTAEDELSLQGRLGVRGVKGHGPLAFQIVDQRLFCLRVTQVVAVRRHQVGGAGTIPQEHLVQPLTLLMQQHMDQGEHEGRVGLRFDRHPLGGGGTGLGEMGLHLNPLGPAIAGIGVTLDAADAAGGLDIHAEGDDVITFRGIRRDDEGAVPQLAVEMLGVVALDPLAAAESHVDRGDRTEEGGEGAHVIGGGAAAAETGGNLGVAGLVGLALDLDLFHLVGDGVQRLVPADGDEFRILVTPFLRIGPFHRSEDAMGIVDLLNQSERLDAHLAAGRGHLRRAEIGLHFGGNTVFDPDVEQVRAGDALVTVGRDLGFAGG